MSQLAKAQWLLKAALMAVPLQNLNIFQIMTAYIVFRQPMSAKPNDFQVQLERLQEKQKQARVNNEHPTSVLILKDIISLCYQAQQWATLNEQVGYLMNRRGQSKKAQVEMIQLAMSWLPTAAEPHRTRLIEAIRDVCAKKIFLEVEYARCVMLIVKSKENENDIMEAAQILQEVQVQTYGSMDKRQKLEFILYQMRIMLKKQDYVRFFIISKKINENNINDADIVDLKVTFYAYMASYYNQQHDYPQACRVYRILHLTLQKATKPIPQTLEFGFSARKEDVLANYIGFLVLQPYSQKNHKQLKELSEQEQLQKQPHALNLINKFLSEEIVSCDVLSYSLQRFQLFRESYSHHEPHLKELKRMLAQHNIRVISKYYGQLTLNRISQLLNVDRDYCEEQLCTLNNSSTISCRIDRIDGVIDFRPVENEQYLLQQWNHSINSILELVDTTTHLIHREREVHRK